MIDLPVKAIGIVSSYTGEGFSNPFFTNPINNFSYKPNSSNSSPFPFTSFLMLNDL